MCYIYTLFTSDYRYRFPTFNFLLQPIEEQSHNASNSSAQNRTTKPGVPSRIPRGQRLVNVNILNGEQIQLRVHRNIQCGKLLDKVVGHQGIRDTSKVLGLAVMEG